MTLEAVDQAIADRKLWRAKEILQGRLASPKFDPDLLRRYGEVLLAMDDKIEAGRHLFCSGFRAPEYTVAMRLCLERIAPPRRGRTVAVDLPTSLRTHLTLPTPKRRFWER
jgi:hypothetical protein